MLAAGMFALRALARRSSVVALATRYQGARAAMRHLDRLMAQPVEREPGKRYVERPDLSGQAALRDVSFAYPAQGGDHPPLVIKRASLSIAAGEPVAILGRIGSGTSSVLLPPRGLSLPIQGLGRGGWRSSR